LQDFCCMMLFWSKLRELCGKRHNGWTYMWKIVNMGPRWVVPRWTCSDGDKTNIKPNLNHLEGIICITFHLLIFFGIIVNPLCS
jgi:hypothetical protein